MEGHLTLQGWMLASRPGRYLSILAALAFLPTFLIQGVVLSAPLKRAVLSFVGEENYLESLRNSNQGCKTLLLESPDIVFIGDSHSYAAWDFVRIARATGANIGGCMLGGLFVDSLPHLLAFVDRMPSLPRHIILGTSPRMFWNELHRPEQLAAHISILDSLATFQWTFPQFIELVSETKGTRSKALDRLQAHEAPIKHLDERAVEARLDQSIDTLTALDAWQKLLAQPPLPRDTVLNATQATCDAIKRTGMKFSLIHIPESPYLEARYSERQRADYAANLALFQHCSDRIVLHFASDYGLQNIDFVNRMLDDIRYESFQSPEPLRDPRLFNLDHMNPLGARRFTDIALRELNLLPGAR
jgi:hypothetical protein